MDKEVDNLKYKKKSSGLIIFLIILLVLLLIGGSILYYLYYKGYFDKKPSDTEEIERIKFFVKSLDKYTHENISVKYILYEGQKIIDCVSNDALRLYNENYTKFNEQFPDIAVLDTKGCYVKRILPVYSSSGRLSTGLNEFNLKKGTTYYLYHFDEHKYYVYKEFFLSVPQMDLNESSTTILNKTVYEMFSVPIEQNLSIKILGEIKSQNSSNIRVVLQGTKRLKYINLCWDWSFGVINIEGNYGKINPPLRIATESEQCFKTDTSIDNEVHERQYDFVVNTGKLINSDYIKLYVIDEEKYEKEYNWVYGLENDKFEDIGALDFVNIKYLNIS